MSTNRRSSSDEDLKRYIGQWKSKPEIVKNRFFLNLKSNNSSTSSITENIVTTGGDGGEPTRALSSQSESSLPTTPVSPTATSSSASSVGSFHFMSRLAGESLFSPSSSPSKRRQRTVSLCSPDDVLNRQQSWNRFEHQQQKQQNLLKTANFYIGAVDSSSKIEPSFLMSTSPSNDIVQVKDEVVGSRKRSMSFTGHSTGFCD